MAADTQIAVAKKRRVAVWLNGQAKQVEPELIGRMRRLCGEAHVFVSHTAHQAAGVARHLLAKPYDVLACGGGDGTLSHAADWLATHGRVRPMAPAPALAFLSLGTGNAFAHVVHSSEPLVDLTRLLFDEALHTVPVPLIERDGGRACFFAGLGYDSLLLRNYNDLRAAWPWRGMRSWLGYAAAIATKTLPHVVGRGPLLHARIQSVGRAWRFDARHHDAPREVGRDVLLHTGPAHFVAVGTIAYFGYGLRIFPFAGHVPRTMQLRVAQLGPARVLGGLWPLWQGTLRDPQRLHDWAVEGVEIRLATPFCFQQSGDDTGLIKQVRLRVGPRPIDLVHYRPAPLA